MSSTPKIIIFSTHGCKYCQKAKTALKQNQLPFRDLDVAFFSQRYKAAVEFTKVETVPLVFFGHKFIESGGSGIEQLAKEGKLVSVYNEVIKNEENQQVPSFLKLPLSAEELEIERKGLWKRENIVQDFLDSVNLTERRFVYGQKSFSYSELVDFLRFKPETQIKVEDHGWLFSKRPKSFKGKQLIEGCKRFLKLEREEISVLNLANALLRSHIIYDVDDQTAFSSCDESATVVPDRLYRFFCDANAAGDFSSFSDKVLNSHQFAAFAFQTQDAAPIDIMSDKNSFSATSSSFFTNQQSVALSQALYHVQEELMSEFRDLENDGLVDYSKMRKNFTSSKNWKNFVTLSSLLQLVNLEKMVNDEKSKISFAINIYNVAVYSAFGQFLVPWSNLQKLNFFSYVGFFIGAPSSSSETSRYYSFWSLNELENGFLRGNRKGVTDFFSRPLSSSDPRVELVVKNVDYRIHFGLNCGAKSCPPVKVFSAENLDQELDVAARAFLQEQTIYDEETNTLITSQILKWYKEDFEVPGKHTTIGVILKYGGEKFEFLKDKKIVNLSFGEYDWDFAAKKE
jgi:glutaredoxin